MSSNADESNGLDDSSSSKHIKKNNASPLFAALADASGALAQKMYEDLAAKTGDTYTKAILEGLHEQEVHHEEKLRSILASIEPTKA